MDHPPLPPPPPTEGPSHSAHSGAMPSTTRGEEESDAVNDMALLLRVVNEGEHVVVNQVVEEVDPSVEVGLDICGATPEPDFSVNEGKPRIH